MRLNRFWRSVLILTCLGMSGCVSPLAPSPQGVSPDTPIAFPVLRPPCAAGHVCLL